jgi:hypothetical protein
MPIRMMITVVVKLLPFGMVLGRLRSPLGAHH